MQFLSVQEERFRPSINPLIAEAIDDLFERYPDIKKYFGGSKQKFTEDAIRRTLIYYEEFKRSGAIYPEGDQNK